MLVLVLMIAFFVPSPAGRAQSGAALTGEVTDRFGAVISDTTISLYSQDRILQTTSDDEGHFELANLAAGSYVVELSHLGFKRKSLQVSLKDRSTERVSIVLDVGTTGDCGRAGSVSYVKSDANSGRKLRGFVGDSSRPLPNANIQVLNAQGTQVVASQRSNQQGEFLFAKLEPGRYILNVSHVGYYDERMENVWITRENQTTVSVVTLRRGLIRICE